MSAGKTLVLDERALKAIADGYTRVRDLGRAFGPTSERYLKAAQSHAQVMSTLFASGFGPEAQVWREDDLSLIVTEGGFTYGVIWFAEKRKCIVEGCPAYLHENGTPYYYGTLEERGGACAPDAHTPDIGYDMPTPGTWSTHS